MQQPCLQQATVKVHQLTHTDPAHPVLLSLAFQCPAEQRRARNPEKLGWLAESLRKNYHLLLFSVLVLFFFALIEWTAPAPAHLLTEQQTDLPSIAKQLFFGQL